MPESVSKKTAKLLKDVTGEPRLDSAVRMTVKDALKHRLKAIDRKIREFREKYDMSFEEFKKAWEEDEIKDKYSYDVEKDFWEWEGLVTRKEKIEQDLSEFE